MLESLDVGLSCAFSSFSQSDPQGQFYHVIGIPEISLSSSIQESLCHVAEELRVTKSCAVFAVVICSTLSLLSNLSTTGASWRYKRVLQCYSMAFSKPPKHSEEAFQCPKSFKASSRSCGLESDDE